MEEKIKEGGIKPVYVLSKDNWVAIKINILEEKFGNIEQN